MSGVSARARDGRCRAACALLLRDLGGFNLLPHRARRRGRMRQRRAFGAACAALGGVGVAAIVAAAVGRNDIAAVQNRQRLESDLASTSVLSFRRALPDREAADTGRTTSAGAFNFTARLAHAGTRLPVSPHEQRVAARGVEQSVHAGEAS